MYKQKKEIAPSLKLQLNLITFKESSLISISVLGPNS